MTESASVKNAMEFIRNESAKDNPETYETYSKMLVEYLEDLKENYSLRKKKEREKIRTNMLEVKKGDLLYLKDRSKAERVDEYTYSYLSPNKLIKEGKAFRVPDSIYYSDHDYFLVNNKYVGYLKVNENYVYDFLGIWIPLPSEEKYLDLQLLCSSDSSGDEISIRISYYRKDNPHHCYLNKYIRMGGKFKGYIEELLKIYREKTGRKDFYLQDKNIKGNSKL